MYTIEIDDVEQQRLRPFAYIRTALSSVTNIEDPSQRCLRYFLEVPPIPFFRKVEWERVVTFDETIVTHGVVRDTLLAARRTRSFTAWTKGRDEGVAFRCNNVVRDFLHLDCELSQMSRHRLQTASNRNSDSSRKYQLTWLFFAFGGSPPSRIEPSSSPSVGAVSVSSSLVSAFCRFAGLSLSGTYTCSVRLRVEEDFDGLCNVNRFADAVEFVTVSCIALFFFFPRPRFGARADDIWHETRSQSRKHVG